jgi:transposase InsO family protein
MGKMNLAKISTVKPKIRTKSKENDENTQNLLNQQFTVSKPNEVWVSDITYVKVGGKWHYVCAIVDLFARKLVACRAGKKADSKLTADTLMAAYNSRNMPKNVLFHSDRGVQYTAYDFRRLIDKLDFLQSFSAKAYPYDNAVSESFFRFLKSEELNRTSFDTFDELELSLFEYANFYNNFRPHSFNDGLTPNQKERNLFVNFK